MLRAVSRSTSREIDASDANPHDGPFVCINPSCRHPVTLHRTRPNPHFQHSRGKANPACEHYGSRPGQISAFRISTPSPSKVVGWEGPILKFSGDPPAHFALSLRLPLPRPGESWDGHIVIHEHGERIVSWEQVKQPVQDLRPRTGYPVTFSGEVSEEYRLLLQNDLPGLRQDFNLFAYGIGATRLLEPYEALQADKDYWVLSEKPLPPVGAPAWIKHSISWHRWYVTLLSLPPLRSMSDEDRAGLERTLQRSLVAPRFRAVIVSPLPHHFSDAGIPVYPDDVGELQIELSGSSKVELLCDGERRGTIRVRALDGIRIAEIHQCGRWTLTLNGHRILEWIKSKVDFFEPPGVGLSAGGQEIPLLSQRAQSWLEAQPAGGTFLIRIPSNEVAECLLVDNAPVAPASLEIAQSVAADREHLIDAGNFGRVAYGRHARAREPLYELDGVRAKVMWLKSIALHPEFSGPHRLTGSPEPSAPGWVADLKRVGWTRSLIAQLREIERHLTRAGVWRV